MLLPLNVLDLARLIKFLGNNAVALDSSKSIRRYHFHGDQILILLRVCRFQI